jgi:hypothetical protein
MINREKYNELMHELQEISAKVRQGICPRCHEQNAVAVGRDGAVFCRECMKIVWRFAE